MKYRLNPLFLGPIVLFFVYLLAYGWMRYDRGLIRRLSRHGDYVMETDFACKEDRFIGGSPTVRHCLATYTQVIVVAAATQVNQDVLQTGIHHESIYRSTGHLPERVLTSRN